MWKTTLVLLFTYSLATVLCDSDIDGKGGVVELNLEKNTTLECNMSDTATNISWTKNSVPVDFSNPEKISRENNTMTISKGNDEDAGTYVCAVGKDFSKNITFYVKTRVRVEKFEKSINAVQGDKLILTCKAYGNPKPVVTWYKDNEAVKDGNGTSHIKFQDANNLTDSQLVIETLEETDRAVYRCSVANDINEANVTIMVRVKDKLAALWPFLGILAEVAVLCTIIFIYEKRRAKQEYDESDTDPNNESKPSTEPKKEDVRQRK